MKKQALLKMRNLFAILILSAGLSGQVDSTVYIDVTSTHLPTQNVLSGCSVVGDIDSDGDFDIVLGSTPFGPGWSGQTHILINDGSGYFSDETLTRLPRDSADTNGITLGDIDNDGDLDLYLANWPQGLLGGGQDNLYLNDGFGFFTDATDRLPQEETDSRNALFFDVNGDNSLDIIIARSPSQLLLNDGTGHFTDVSITHIPLGTDTLHTSKTLAVDIDNDWDLDLIVVNAWNITTVNPQQEEIWKNNGNGIFTRQEEILQSDLEDPGLSGDTYDLNHDGILDLIVAQVYQNELYLSADADAYTNVTTTNLPPNFRTADIQLGDINCDGNPDLVLANGIYPNQLFLNNGVNVYTNLSATYLPDLGLSSCNAVNLFDMDNDADLDIHFAADGDGQNRLLKNTGNWADTLPPVIRHNSNRGTWQDSTGKGQLRVFVEDASRWIKQVFLYRYADNTLLDSIKARYIGGDLYQVTVDSQLANRSWQYAWRAEDFAGNQNRLPSQVDSLFGWFPQPYMGISDKQVMPSTFEISVSPNPSNARILIKVDIPDPEKINALKISIFNLRGQQVKVHYDYPRGEHRLRVPLDVTGFASGVYFLVVESIAVDGKKYQASHKITILK